MSTNDKRYDLGYSKSNRLILLCLHSVMENYPFLSLSLSLSSVTVIAIYGFLFVSQQTGQRTLARNNGIPCWPRDFGHGSPVCQCNDTYCDTIPPISKENLKPGYYYQILSNKNGSRFEVSQRKMVTRTPSPEETASTVTISIDRAVKFQTIKGFGGAFTDSTGLNIASLNEPLQETIIRQYFDELVGLNYTFARVPMGGSDFSIRTYTYDDYEDEALANFRLQTEDLVYKIPYIQRALHFQPRLKLLASPWSAPTWMKTNHAFTGKGFLQLKHYQTWANYFIKFLEGYASHNITFWGVTTQNEPTAGTMLNYPWNCMGWTAEQQRDWIKGNLGPTLQNSSFSHVKIIMLDDDRINLALWPSIIMRDAETAKFISGIGVHWYVDGIVSAHLLETTHNRFPDKWLLGTEGCTGYLGLEPPVILGSWERGELYGEDIISDLNHWVTGWVDWNMALNTSGGPNWANNEVDSPIIVDYEQNVIYKQPMFYVLGHFSKFIPRGSWRIFRDSDNFQGLSVLTCLRPDGLVTVIILNILTNEFSLQLNDSHSGLINLVVGPNSIYTIIYA